MRSAANIAFHAILAAVIASLAATSAAAADPAYIKFGGVEGDTEASSDKPRIAVIEWSWGETRAKKKGNVEYTWKVEEGESAPPAPGGVTVAAGDVTGDGSAASGLPTGKRQHKPMTLTMPLDKGSMSFRGQLTGCAPGTTHRSATMLTRAYTYEFKDVVITNCGTGSGGGGGSLPMEEISFNYGKLITKATTAAQKATWDVKKQEGR